MKGQVAWLTLAIPVLVLSQSRTSYGLPRCEWWAWLVLVAGPILASWSSSSTGVSSRVTVWIALVAGIVWALLTPAPASWAATATAGMALGALCSDRMGSACAVSTSFLVMTIVHWVIPAATTRMRWESGLASAMSHCLGLVGVDAAAFGRTVYVSSFGSDPSALVVTDASIGLRESIALLAGAIVLQVMYRRQRSFIRPAMVLVGAVLVAIAVRWGAALVAVTMGVPAEILANVWFRSLSIGLPFALTVMLTGRRRGTQQEVTAQSAPLQVPRAVIVTTSIAVATCWSMGVCPQEPRPGKVVVDERHSRWERLDRGLTPWELGPRSEYNYSEWIRGLRTMGAEVEVLSEPLTATALKDVAVLIIKTPTEEFAKEEVAAIHQFVRCGGGLYLVGDHTDVFGVNSTLNTLAQEYGVHFNSDGLFELDIAGNEVHDFGALPPHPLTRHARPMHWMTSCSLTVSWPARPVIWSNLSFADEPDYSRYTFFGDHEIAYTEPVGNFAQVAVVHPGQGRVLAFTDSTLFSNFSVFLPGVRELAFGGVRWLQLKDRYSSLVAAIGWLAVVLFGCGVWISPRLSPDTTLVLALAGSALGFGLVEYHSSRVMRGWDAGLKAQATVFDMSVCSGTLPVWHESHGTKDELWEFMVAFQRWGDITEVSLDHEDIWNGRAAVLVWPKHPLPSGLVARAEDFVRNGGRLYVLDDVSAAGSAANAILGPFAMRIDEPRRDRRIDPTELPGALTALHLDSSCGVWTGRGLLHDSRGTPIVARKQHGAGVVVAAGLGRDLSSFYVGAGGGFGPSRAKETLRVMYEIIRAGVSEDRERAVK